MSRSRETRKFMILEVLHIVRFDVDDESCNEADLFFFHKDHMALKEFELDKSLTQKLWIVTVVKIYAIIFE